MSVNSRVNYVGRANGSMRNRLFRFFASPSRVMAGGLLMRVVRELDCRRSDNTTAAAIQLTVDAVIADWIQGSIDESTAQCRLGELRDKLIEVLADDERCLVQAVRFQVDAAIELVECERPYALYVEGVAETV